MLGRARADARRMDGSARIREAPSPANVGTPLLRSRGAWAPVFALGLTLCAVMLVPVSNASASAPDVAPSTSELVLNEQQLLVQIAHLQRRMIVADEQYELVESKRDRALADLSAHLVALYQQGDHAGLAQLLSVRDIGAIVDQARITNDITSYELQLVRELDDAEQQARIDREHRDVLAEQVRNTRLSLDTVQRRLSLVRDEAERRAAERQAQQLARQQAAALSLQQVPFSLAGGGSSLLASFSTPGVVTSAMFANFASGPASAVSIDAYLTSKGSPMGGSGFFFMLSGRRWGIDPRLVVAIAGAESSFGSVTCGTYNAWGWACPNDPAEFDSWADGIETISEGLRHYYIDEGHTTVTLIQQKYAPSGAANDPTGLNNHWVINVSKFLLEQGGNPNNLITGAPLLTTAGFGGSTAFS